MKQNIIKILITMSLLFIFITKIEIHPAPILTEVKSEEPLKLTPVNVYQKILDYEIEHPKIVFSQVMLETGRLKSGGAKIHNNLFGFTTKNGHKVFDNWEDSIAYYKKWQERKYNGGDYYTFLQNVGYAEDTLYINKLTKIRNNLEKRWSGQITF